MSFSRILLIAFLGVVMMMCIIAMAASAWSWGDRTDLDEPVVTSLDDVQGPASGSLWIEFPEVEVFSGSRIWQEHWLQPATADEEAPMNGWYYLPLVGVGDPIADEASAHIRESGATDRDGLGPEGRRLLDRVHDAARVFVRVRSWRWDGNSHDIQNGATRARGVLRDAPDGLRRALGRGNAEELYVLDLDEAPVKTLHAVLVFVVSAVILTLTLRHARRRRVLGPDEDELYTGLGGYPFQVTVELMILLGAALDRRAPDGKTSLHKAVMHHHRRVARRLVARGIDLNAVDDQGQTALHNAAAVLRDHEMVLLLLECGADPDVRDGRGLTPAELERVHPSSINLGDEQRRLVQKVLAARADSHPRPDELVRSGR